MAKGLKFLGLAAAVSDSLAGLSDVLGNIVVLNILLIYI